MDLFDIVKTKDYVDFRTGGGRVPCQWREDC